MPPQVRPLAFLLLFPFEFTFSGVSEFFLVSIFAAAAAAGATAATYGTAAIKRGPRRGGAAKI